MRSSPRSSEELIEVFRGLIAEHKLVLKVNHVKTFEGLWALDVEHDEQGTFVGCGLYNPDNGVYYFSDLDVLSDCDFHAVSLICHNGRSDFDCLRQWGINVTENQLYWDTELVCHIIDSSRHGYGLKSLANSDLNISYPSYDDIVGKRTLKQIKERQTLDKQPTELVMMYNAMDCLVMWKLYESQKGHNALQRSFRGGDKIYFQDLERPIAFILSQMENRGICVDLSYLRKLQKTLESQKLPLEQEIHNELGIVNLNSPKQLLEALHEKEIYPIFKGKPSTDKRALEVCKDESGIIQALRNFSEIETLLTAFVRPYLERGESIVHPWFNQCGTRTGRLSCSNPNLLQIPRRTENGKLVRRMFTARPGFKLGDCDFGQIEPRVMAHLSKDPVLCEMFNNGVDFHTFTADRLSISRDRAKVLNLSVGYRATKYSVQRQLGGTLEEAQREIDAWWNLFPALRRWQDKLLYESKRSGFCTTLYGRRIRVEGLQDGNPWKREAAERQVINNITQGSAAELMKLAMIKISEADYYSPSFGLLVQVYDELVFESGDIEHDLLMVKEDMESCYPDLLVPLVVEGKTGDNWSEVH